MKTMFMKKEIQRKKKWKGKSDESKAFISGFTVPLISALKEIKYKIKLNVSTSWYEGSEERDSYDIANAKENKNPAIILLSTSPSSASFTSPFHPFLFTISIDCFPFITVKGRKFLQKWNPKTQWMTNICVQQQFQYPWMMDKRKHGRHFTSQRWRVTLVAFQTKMNLKNQSTADYDA